MSAWVIAVIALGAFAVWATAATIRERGRQRAVATTRPPLTAAEFCDLITSGGVGAPLAAFLYKQLKPYYCPPLTPYPSDRIYGDMKIDPDDISEIALRFEEQFRAWLGEVPIDCPSDPTIAEFGLALQRAV